MKPIPTFAAAAFFAFVVGGCIAESFPDADGGLETPRCADECQGIPNCEEHAGWQFDVERGCSVRTGICVALSPGPEVLTNYESPDGDCVTFPSGDASGDWVFIDDDYDGECDPNGAYDTLCSEADGGG